MKNMINQEFCKQCKLCIEVCPCNVIVYNGKVHFIDGNSAICLKCGQCMAVCSQKAININTLYYGTNILEKPENKLSYDDFQAFIMNRRSIRNFRGQPVPREILEKIIHAVSFAPFGSAHDAVHITVINNREVIRKALPFMSEFYDQVVKWLENPIMQFIIKKKKGQETFNTMKNHLYPIAKSGNYKLDQGDRITRGAPALIIFHADKGAEEHTNNSLIYAVYAMLAAHSLGLGSTLVGLVPAAINKVAVVKNIFTIPKNHEAIISLVVGYPKIQYKYAIKREKHNVHWINE